MTVHRSSINDNHHVIPAKKIPAIEGYFLSIRVFFSLEINNNSINQAFFNSISFILTVILFPTRP